MPIKLHKPESPPGSGTSEDRPRVTKTHGFPRFLVGLAAVALVVLAVFFYFKWSRLNVRGRVIAAFAEYVTEGPCRVTKVNFALDDAVKQGDVVLSTETTDFKSQAPQYEAALEQTKSRLAIAKAGGDVGVVDLSYRNKRLSDARQAADVAATRLSAAQKSEEEYSALVTATTADRQKEIDKAEADVATSREKLKEAQGAQKEATAAFEGAKVNWEIAEKLQKEEAITVTEHQAAKTKFEFASGTCEKTTAAVAEAAASLAGAEKAAESIAKKYDADLAAAEKRLARAKADTGTAAAFDKNAKADLANAEAEMSGTKSDPKKMGDDEIAFLERQVAEAEGRLTYFKALAGTVDFKAPFAGTVCELNKVAGDSAEKDERIVALYDSKTAAIEVRVPEDDLDRVKKDQNAEVSIRGTGIRFSSKVEMVNATPARLPGELKTGPGSPESAYDRYVTCRVGVPDEVKKRLKPGMRANVTIYTW